MKKYFKYLAFVALFIVAQVNAENTNPFMNYDPEYTRVITGRSDKIVAVLGIEDTAQYSRVLDIVVEQYRNLSAIHDFKDTQLEKAGGLEGQEREKAKQAAKDSANAQLYLRHVHFLAQLASELSPEQVEMVKDGMTYSVFHNTYNGFMDMLPELTGAQKRYIYTALYEARERAMDQGSSKAKHAMFGKYKGRINNYLSGEGYDLAKASKEWEERLRKEREKNKQ